jgi:hypothetical protein
VGSLETMLGGVAGEGGVEVGKKEALKDFDRWGQKGDRTIGGTEGRGFVRFNDGNDGGAFPDNRKVSVREREVKGSLSLIRTLRSIHETRQRLVE